MKNEHLISAAIYGPCAAGGGITGAHSTGPVAHVAENAVYCEKCCIVCHPPAFAFTEPMPTGAVAGRQEDLFA